MNKKVAAILNELFQFNDQIEELCIMSEAEGEFGMPANEMIFTLRDFIQANI